MRAITLIILIMSFTCSAAFSETKQTTTDVTLENGAKLFISELLVSGTDIELDKCNVEFDCYGLTSTDLKNTKHTYVSEIVFHHKFNNRGLDARNMYNAWSHNKKEEIFFFGDCLAPDTCLIRGLFSKGASTYFVEWKICDGKQKRRITKLDNVIRFYKKNIKKMLVKEYNKSTRSVPFPSP